MDEAKFRQLKRQADDARTTRDRAVGQLSAAMARLKEEFGCDTVAAAKKLLGKLEEETAAAETAYDEAVAEFKEAWDEHLQN